MKRNKYLNTFDNTADYENYIESAYPGFPNVGLTKDDGELHYMRTSPNDHLLYGEVVDKAQALPTISLSGTVNTPTLEEVNNAFYLDSWSNAAPTSILINNKSNIKTIKKLKGLDTSNVKSMYYMFSSCSSLTTLDLSNFNTSKVTNIERMFNDCSSLTSLDLSNWNTSNVNVGNMFYAFNNCSSLKDVYITEESTLNKLTNNLTSQGGNYIPSNNGNCTIHYNYIDYKWNGSAWTPQS